MPIVKILSLVVRSLQMLFGAVVLGLSVKAIKWQTFGSPPATHDYATFSGALALFIGLAGFAATFISTFKLETPFLFADGIATAVLMAGGVSYAVQLKDVDCRDKYNPAIYCSKLLNGGCKVFGDEGEFCGAEVLTVLQQRCRMLEADTTFVFLAFVMGVGAVVLGLMDVRKAWKGNGIGGRVGV